MLIDIKSINEISYQIIKDPLDIKDWKVLNIKSFDNVYSKLIILNNNNYKSVLCPVEFIKFLDTSELIT